MQSGTIYVVRTKSQVPYIAERRHLVHKIGFTKGSVERRIAAAATEATFLFAEAEVVAEYKLYSVSKSTLETILHRFFEAARLKIRIPDRFGRISCRRNGSRRRSRRSMRRSSGCRMVPY